MCRSIAAAAASASRAAMASAIAVCSASVRLVCATSFTARSTQTRISDRTVVSRSVSRELPGRLGDDLVEPHVGLDEDPEVVAVLPHRHERRVDRGALLVGRQLGGQPGHLDLEHLADLDQLDGLGLAEPEPPAEGLRQQLGDTALEVGARNPAAR